MKNEIKKISNTVQKNNKDFKDELKQKLEAIVYLEKQVSIWKQKLKVANTELSNYLNDVANPNNQISILDLQEENK